MGAKERCLILLGSRGIPKNYRSCQMKGGGQGRAKNPPSEGSERGQGMADFECAQNHSSVHLLGTDSVLFHRYPNPQR